jgi:hypothetical protein
MCHRADYRMNEWMSEWMRQIQDIYQHFICYIEIHTDNPQ